jgi:hypothetical protein
MKLVASIGVAVLLAFGLGWFLGASGKSTIELDRRQHEQRADLAEARGLVLEGRVALFQLNFGDAAKRFDSARAILERAQMRLRETGQAERAGQLEVALAHLKDAGRLAVALDPTAQSAAEQALQAIGK